MQVICYLQDCQFDIIVSIPLRCFACCKKQKATTFQMDTELYFTSLHNISRLISLGVGETNNIFYFRLTIESPTDTESIGQGVKEHSVLVETNQL